MNIEHALPLPSCRARQARESLPLRAHEIWSAPLAVGWSLRCETGVLWLTQSGDSADYLFEAGAMFHDSYQGKVVVQALQTTTFTVDLAEENR